MDELSEAEDVMNDLAVWNIQLKSKVLFISIEQMLRHEECVSIVQKWGSNSTHHWIEIVIHK